MRTYCIAQGTLLNALWWPKWEGNLKKRETNYIAIKLKKKIKINTLENSCEGIRGGKKGKVTQTEYFICNETEIEYRRQYIYIQLNIIANKIKRMDKNDKNITKKIKLSLGKKMFQWHFSQK